MLVSLERALAELLAAVRPVEPRPVPVEGTQWRVLAEPLRAPAPIPAHAVALRDGWAAAASDVIGASSYSPVLTASPPPWVEVGEAMPAGTDAVLPPDAVTARNGSTEIVAEAAPGEGVRRAGEDAGFGAILREAGERMRPADLAVALAAGSGRILVRETRVCVLSPPGPAGLDASRELVGRLAEAAGAVVERVALSSRDAKAITARLMESEADLVVVVGGTGFGRADHAAEALAASGSLIARGVALRPGETSGCGVVAGRPVILVPGRLEAALAATLTLVLPCLDRLMGATPRFNFLTGQLTRKVSSTVGLTDVVLLRRTWEGLEPLAVGDLTLAAIAGADAWLAVPPFGEGFAAGETVTAFVL